MKRFITVLLSVLMALVMCFAVIACGDDTNTNPTEPEKPGIDTPGDDDDDNTDPEPPKVPAEVINQAVAAVRKLYTSDSYAASATLSFDTQNREAMTHTVAFDKRGDMIHVEAGESAQSYILNLRTGYMYIGNSDDGYVAKPVAPADTIGYLAYSVEQYIRQYAGEVAPPESETPSTGIPAAFKPDVSAAYDEPTKTLSVSIAAAEQLNNTLAPLYDAYKKNKTIRAMLDDYVKDATDNVYTFSMIFDSLMLMATTNADATFDQANTMIKTVVPELDMYDVLEQVFDMTDELRGTIASRTLGEIMSGAYDYITQIISNPPTSVEQLQGVVYGLMTSAFIDETEYTPEKLAEIKAAVNVLLSTNVKTILDMALVGTPEALAFVSNGVTFETFGTDIDVTFDADGNIASLNISAELKHSYDGETEGFKILSDNEYKYDLALELSDYADTHEPFDGDITLADGRSELAALIYGDIENDVSVYIETAGEDIAEIASVVYLYYADDITGDVTVADASVATIDAENSSVVIDAQFVNDILINADGASAWIIVALADGTQIRVMYVDESDIQFVVSYIVGSIMN